MIAKSLVLGLGLGLTGTVLAALELPRHAELDLAAARQLADASLAHCTAAVSVLDRGGNLLVAMRGDGVGPHNGPASQRKAYTALSTKTSSRLFAERARNNPEAANLNTVPELLLLGGGLALFAGNQLVGAIGIAGAGGAAQDEACAVQAAQRVGLATEAGRE
ncbi:GlcG/HbpS family heme-binding protein [Pseudomonas protegens]|uniref:GlcG/HbpS family heme-binding protein n=1 Tax=Pseudomonas protegens TaxID=380021 RepID=UPI000643B7FE|nr:heme-binding protein [Pseudomonas protegens]